MLFHRVIKKSTFYRTYDIFLGLLISDARCVVYVNRYTFYSGNHASQTTLWNGRGNNLKANPPPPPPHIKTAQKRGGWGKSDTWRTESLWIKRNNVDYLTTPTTHFKRVITATEKTREETSSCHVWGYWSTNGLVGTG